MTSQEPAWQAAEAAAEALAPEAGEFASVDLAGFGESTLAVLLRAAGNPGDMVSAWHAVLGQHGEDRAGRRGALARRGR